MRDGVRRSPPSPLWPSGVCSTGRNPILNRWIQILITAAAVLIGGAAGCASQQPNSPPADRPSEQSKSGLPPDSRPSPEALRAEIRKLDEYLAASPQDARARFQLANLYLAAHEPPKALQELRVLEREHADAPEVLLLKGIVLRVSGRPAEAAEAARRFLSLHPGEEAALVLLGDTYLDRRQSEEALATFDQCLKKHPKAYGALVGRAQALEQLFQSYFPVSVPEILRPLEEAVRLEPNNPQGVILLARMTFAYRNRLDEAEELALRATELEPQNATPHALLAGIALARPATPENLRAAAHHAQEAMRRDPTDPGPPYYLGRVHLQQNDPERAAESLEKSIALRALPEAVSDAAVAYRRLNSEERAAHYSGIYRRYTELDGRRKVIQSRLSGAKGADEVRHLYSLVELYLEAGQPEDAEAWLKEARKVRKRDPRAEQLQAGIADQRRTGERRSVLEIP